MYTRYTFMFILSCALLASCNQKEITKINTPTPVIIGPSLSPTPYDISRSTQVTDIPTSTASLLSPPIHLIYLTRQNIITYKDGIKNEIPLDCLFCGYSLSLSPDGRQFLYAGYKVPGDPQEIFTINAGGKSALHFSVRQEAPIDPAWSPDGNFIVFSNDTENADLFLFSVLKNETSRVTNTPGLEGEPIWSPDGEQIAFIYRENRNEKGSLWVMDRDGNNRRMLTDVDVAIRQISWSPAENYIAFSSPHTCGEIFIINILTAEAKKVGEGRGCYSNPAWSPDGKYLAYVEIYYDPPQSAWVSHWNIILAELDNGNKTIVLSGNKEDDTPFALILATTNK